MNKIKYGNPNFLQSKALSEVHYLDSILPSLRKDNPPANDSFITIEELNRIALMVRVKTKEEKITIPQIIIGFDPYLFHTLKEANVFLQQDTYTEMSIDAYSIGIKLQYFFNRPRPYQLATYYNLALFPPETNLVSQPSYPSIPYLKSLLIKELFSDKHNYNIFEDICEDVKQQHLSFGLNYDSDFIFTKKVFDVIINNLGFRKKFRLNY
ncbi:MAG: hypothetical protein ACRDE2_00115 [Chitinophagaceae bacterium]